jgi:hypothetical protein
MALRRLLICWVAIAAATSMIGAFALPQKHVLCGFTSI